MKSVTIIILFIPFLLFSQTTTDILDMSLEELMQVKVKVGTRTQGHTEFNSLVPVEIIEGSTLAESGAELLGEALRFAIPGFNYYQPTITDGSDHVRPATYRGLQPDQMLVLINGQRWQSSALLHVNGTVGRGSAGYDFDAIPLSAIERIEVLKDGAAAQYGSDAIAGILNIVLKSDATSTIETGIGDYSHGDGFTKSGNLKLNSVLGKNGNLNVFFNYFDRDYTNYANPDPRPQYFDGDPRNDDPTIKNRVSHRYGLPVESDYQFMTNFNQPFSESGHLSGFSLISFRQSRAAGFFRRPRDPRNVRAIYPDGFLPFIAPDNLFYTLSLNAESGSAKTLNKKIGIAVSGNKINFNVENSLNASLGNNSPTNFYCGSLFYGQYLLTFDLFRRSRIWGKEFNLATGGEFRLENYKIVAGEEASYIHGGINVLDGPDSGMVTAAGAQVFPGFNPDNATDKIRTNASLYLDVEFNPVKQTTMGIAIRAEDYSDFGITTNGKISVRVQPLKALAVRSTISSGFRAPSLAQSYYTSTTTGFHANQLYDIGTFGVNAPISKALGTTALKPEKSKHFSFGISLNNSKSFDASLDFFYLTIKDRIVFSGEFLNNPSLFDPDIIDILNRFNVSGVRFFTNAVDTKTSGFDLRMQFSREITSALKFNGTVAHHYNHTQMDGPIKTPSILSDYGSVILDDDEQNRLTGIQPRHFSQLELTFSNQVFSMASYISRFGAFYGDRSNQTSREKFPSRIITSMMVRFKLHPNLEIFAGIRNLFNVYPEKRSPTDLVRQLFPYSLNSPFGFSGRFFTSKIILKI